MKQKIINKWHVLTGGFFSYMFDAMDITLLAVALPVMMKELDMTMSEGGLLGTATLLGVGISSIVVGWYSDNYGRRKALIWSLALFGILTAAIGLSPNWITILILRFLAGLGLGGVWGIIAAYIAETWPAKQRGRAAAFVLSSFPAGAGISAFLASVIIPTYGWRGLFIAGAGSLLAALYIYFFVPESEVWKQQRQERQQKGEAVNVSISEIFSKDLIKITFFATLSASFALVAYWGSTTWIPTFLIKERGLDMQTMSIFFLILNIGMFVGYNLFGYLADIIGRKKAIILSFLGTTITLPIYVMSESSTALLLLGPVYAFFISFAGLFGSYFGELYPTRVRTLGAGFCFNVGRGVSAFSPFVLGFVAANYGLTIGIGICAIFFFLAAIAMLFLPNTRIE
ncbi:MFS transporter [Orbus sasakiae]|uniref:MFS transporter n=1 Tax=Orbus sasakiae TaxID=1078475 RepID=A0ABP9N4A4_9GAMM